MHAMRAIDTNVVVRFLADDDPEQSRIARAIIGREPVFVARSVMLEAEWVLRAVYDLPVAAVLAALRGFAGLPQVEIEDAALVSTALGWADAGLDFADALHLAAAKQCEAFVTFDKRFRRDAARVAGTAMVAR